MVALAVMKRSTDHFHVIGKDLVSEPDEEVGRMFRAREMSTHKGLEEDVVKVTPNSLLLLEHKVQHKSEWREDYVGTPGLLLKQQTGFLCISLAVLKLTL